MDHVYSKHSVPISLNLNAVKKDFRKLEIEDNSIMKYSIIGAGVAGIVGVGIFIALFIYCKRRQ